MTRKSKINWVSGTLLSVLFVAACQTTQGEGGGPSLDAAERAYSYGRYEEAHKDFSRLAAAGEEEAYIYLALLYLNGWGVEESRTEANRWAGKAAASGEAWGHVILGDAHIRGFAVEQDVPKGLEHLETAANLDLAYARYLLGSLYYNGEYVEEDRIRGLGYWIEAAEDGHARAQYRLGRAYLREGPRGSASHDAALYWLYRAYLQARKDAGSAFIPKNEGSDWDLSESAREAFAHQSYLRGKDEREGLGGTPDRVGAYMWFMIAANHGSRLAADALGEQGMGLTELQVREIQEKRIASVSLQNGLTTPAEHQDLEKAKRRVVLCARNFYRNCG